MYTIEASGVVKSFGKKQVLKGLDLKVKKGSIHAVLGPNGSGKSTLVKILTTLLTADSGSIQVAGFDVYKEGDKVREAIQLTGQNASVDDELTGYENLYLMARLFGYNSSQAKRRANELLFAFDLQGSANNLVRTYSGGMRRKLDVAASIISAAEVLFLDEPTTGLDPRSRNSLWSIIRRLANRGTTVLLTTQYLEEAEQLADKVSVIDGGRVISEGSIEELKASVGTNILHVSFSTVPDGQQLEGLEGGNTNSTYQVDTDQKKIAFPVLDYAHAIKLLEKLKLKDLPVTGFNLSRPDLNEVFLALTGRSAEEQKEVQNAEGPPLPPSPIVLIEHAHVFKNPGLINNKLMFGWRNLIKIKHIPEQFVDVLITPVMFTFMFTFLFGGALAGSTTEYLHFLIPGILVQTMAFNSAYAGINISNDINKGIFDRFKSMPIWSPAPLAGIFIGDFFRHLLSGLLVLLFGYIMGYRADASFPAFAISFLIMIAFAMSISWVFIIMGLTMRSTSAVMSVGWLILMPIVFLSNIFADPATMPDWLNTFISYNPLAWQVNAVRGLLGGLPDTRNIAMALGASAFITLILFPVAVFFYKKER